jgi:hypothetical protein
MFSSRTNFSCCICIKGNTCFSAAIKLLKNPNSKFSKILPSKISCASISSMKIPSCKGIHLLTVMNLFYLIFVIILNWFVSRKIVAWFVLVLFNTSDCCSCLLTLEPNLILWDELYSSKSLKSVFFSGRIFLGVLWLTLWAF